MSHLAGGDPVGVGWACAAVAADAAARQLIAAGAGAPANGRVESRAVARR